MTSHPLPGAPHPIASAFFDAHDDELEAPKQRSTTVTKIRNSIGWRTRFSSSQLYPVSILPVEGSRRLDRGKNESESFHVRQVFPRQSNIKKFSCNDGIENCNHQHDGSDGDDDIEKLPISTISEDDCEFGTGATVWPGCIVLLKYLEKLAHDPKQVNILKGKTVADLGSGTAITSIASALLGANMVVCTDGCDPVVDLARRNIHDAISMLSLSADKTEIKMADKQNHVDFRGCKMITQLYRWGEGMQLKDVAWDQHFDVILGADCIVPKLYPIEPLVDAIDELSGDETVTYLSYEQRYYQQYDPAKEFRRLAAMRNLDVEVVPDHEMHEMYPANDIQIWKVRRNNKLGMSVNRPKSGVQKMRSTEGTDRCNHKSLLVGKHS